MSPDPSMLEPPKPHGVVRLNRRGVWALGVTLVAVAVAAIVALKAQEAVHRRREGEKLPPPPPEARWYQKESNALVQRPTPEVVPTPVPAATPELLPKVEEKDRLAVRREQAYLRALDAKAIVPEFQRSAVKGEGPSAQGVSSGLPNLAMPAGLAGLPNGGDAGMGDDQNLQQRKEDFLQLGARGDVLDARARPPLSRYEVKAGSVIPAVLVAGVNSDLPGEVIAQIRENVYDSASGAYLVLPQGTRLVGAYDSHIAYGQDRVLIKWSRLIFPNGKSTSLGHGMPGADAEGYGGFSDEVDNHLVSLFGRAILLSVITAGVELSQRGFENRPNANGVGAGDIASAALGQNLGQVSAEVVRRGLNRQPTIIIRPGYRFNVIATQDLVFDSAYIADVTTPRGEERP